MGRTKSTVQKPIRETITYPVVKVTERNSDPCTTDSMPYDHLLLCGHLIQTAEPDEPCGDNCQHVVLAKQHPDQKRKGFLCQACIEEIVENEIRDMVILTDLRAQDEYRNKLQLEADLKAMLDDRRHCYVALKIVSVPCDQKGNPLSSYTPRPVHPLDKSIPPAGENMFEDVPDEVPEAEMEDERAPEPRHDRPDSDIPNNIIGVLENETVEAILDHRYEGTVRVYLAKWARHEGADWMPGKYLHTCQDLVAAYDKTFMESKREGFGKPKEKSRRQPSSP